MHLGKTSSNILLIDDDADTRDLYGEFLTQAGYKVDFALTGEEGLAKIRQGGYDLILLDIMLPKIDGLGILKKLKENPPSASVYNGPIVILSALDQEYIIKQALSLGARGFLAKAGLTPNEALTKIAEFVKNPSENQESQ